MQDFHTVCTAADSGEDALRRLGRLMYESHESLRDDYECSHPRLDEIVELSRELAYGARLTGAGWGGCTVALVPPAKVQPYIGRLKEKFYGRSEGVEALVFATAPNEGACVYA